MYKTPKQNKEQTISEHKYILLPIGESKIAGWVAGLVWIYTVCSGTNTCLC